MKPNDDPGRVPPVIILAGGRSSRFGSPKGLAVFEGRTLLAAHLDACHQFGAFAVIVTGIHHDSYAEEVARIVSETNVRAHCVVNPDPDRGPFSSIQVGMSAVPDFSDGVIVQPVDTGPVDAEFLQALRQHAGVNQYTVVPLANGKGGHPVFLSPAVVKRCVALNAQSPDARLDRVLRQLSDDEIRRVEFSDARILRDFNASTHLF